VPIAPRPDSSPVSLGGHAAENLSFIRQTMERGATFTAVPGVGGCVMGAIALVAAAVGSWQPMPERWLLTWLGAAAIAATVGLTAMARKARHAGATLTGANGRRFAAGLAAPFVAGAAITYELWAIGTFSAMPTVWLLLYGAGLVTGGIVSVPAVRWIGGLFMLFGVAAMLTPPEWGNTWLALGFGGLQLGFGVYIARNHGG